LGNQKNRSIAPRGINETSSEDPVRDLDREKSLQEQHLTNARNPVLSEITIAPTQKAEFHHARRERE
jgi:hypothetical protein